jgi:hypothetical protein
MFPQRCSSHHQILHSSAHIMCIRLHYHYRNCTNQGQGKKRHYRIGDIISTHCPRHDAYIRHINQLYAYYGRDWTNYCNQFVPCSNPEPSWGSDESIFCPTCSLNRMRGSEWHQSPDGREFYRDGSAGDFLDGNSRGYLGEPF